MTSSDTQEPVELTCAECEQVFIPNLGATVLGHVSTLPDGSPGPYLHFCSPQCADVWHAAHG
jgi:hypothetical protein